MNRFLVCLVLTIALLTTVSCGGPSVDTSDPEAFAKSVFGEPKDEDDSGITSFQFSDGEALIQYNYFPVGVSTYSEELGINLAPKLKKLYETNLVFDKMTIVAYGPFKDSYGNITWKPMLSMELDRAIITQINWDNFAKQDLIKIAKNVEIFRE